MIRIGPHIAARWHTPRQTPRIRRIMGKQAIYGIGGHRCPMAWSGIMAKPPRKPGNDSERIGKVRRAGDLVADISGVAFKKFGFVQGAIVQRWPEIVGSKYASMSMPESIRFPTGRKAGGVLTLLVEGAQAPLIQHLAPMIMEKVNAFFGYGAVDRIVFRQGKLPRPKKGPPRPTPRPVPKELGEGLREIADPELRACLESLASSLEGSQGVPIITTSGKLTDSPSSKEDNKR